mgnify:CR=1 FL=1
MSHGRGGGITIRRLTAAQGPRPQVLVLSGLKITTKTEGERPSSCPVLWTFFADFFKKSVAGMAISAGRRWWSKYDQGLGQFHAYFR